MSSAPWPPSPLQARSRLWYPWRLEAQSHQPPQWDRVDPLDQSRQPDLSVLSDREAHRSGRSPHRRQSARSDQSRHPARLAQSDRLVHLGRHSDQWRPSRLLDR